LTLPNASIATSQQVLPPNGSLMGLAALMRQAFAGVDLRPLGTQLVQRANQYPGDANTLMDLSWVLQLTGNRELGLNTQALALKLQQYYRLPTASSEPNIRLLAIVSGGDLMANTPLEFLVEQSDVALDLLYVDTDLPLPATLQEHDLVFVAVGESDHNRPLLEHIAQRAQSWEKPLLNAPLHIAELTRDGVAAALGGVSGVSIPASARVSRALLQQVAEGAADISTPLPQGAFPVIIRPVGSHAGHGLEKLDDRAALAAYLLSNPEPDFYVARFIDYRSADGQFRKYRVILIAGRPYICHMAISSHWMIHYLNAGMAESAEKRAEEAQFMANFDSGFARRHAQAFEAVAELLKLDYVGLDCGETPDGKLLIFEADSDMVVHALDPVDLFPYKPAVMRKLFSGFREMLEHALTRARGMKFAYHKHN